jgi:hypothetical protein
MRDGNIPIVSTTAQCVFSATSLNGVVRGLLVVLASLTSPVESVAATLLLSNHASTPEGIPNQFAEVSATSDVNDAPYYAFTITAMGGDVEIVELAFTLTDVSGISPLSDFSDYDFGIDSDLNLDVTAEEQVANVVTATTTQITINGFSSLRMIDGQATLFVLEMDVNTVAPGDRFTIDLVPAGIQAISGSNPIAVTGDSFSATHISP